MPVRSLSSRVLKWPDREQVDRALREWAASVAASRSGLRQLGYFGSYARGDWGVGSDLDIVAIVEESHEPFHRRSMGWDVSGLPVPADLLVYSVEEWQRLQQEGKRFVRTLERETVWVFSRGTESAPAIGAKNADSQGLT